MDSSYEFNNDKYILIANEISNKTYIESSLYMLDEKVQEEIKRFYKQGIDFAEITEKAISLY